MLKEPGLALSAAVRLVRLSGEAPLCVPAELTESTAAKLRVVPLGDGLWAVGLRDRSEPDRLHAPVLLGQGGTVFRVAEGTEEEALILHISSDPDVFPHLLISPARFWVVAAPPKLAVTRAAPEAAGFVLGEEEGWRYVALRLGREGAWREVARYLWDSYELAFMGPACDRLPQPPGGKFRVDLEASPLLVPVGGEIPEPEPIEPLPVEPDSGDDVL